MAADPDAALMVAFRDGDRSAFDVLVERYRRPLLTYFASVSRDRDAAEDLTQELFVKLFRHRADYEPKASFRTYVFSLARNVWIDAYRSRRRFAGERSLDALDDVDALPLQARLAGSEESPERGAERSELAGAIAKAAARLPESLREVFVLGAVEQLDYSEVSRVLGVPLGTVKSRMFHAVRKLRTWLEPEFVRRALSGTPRHEP